MNKRIASITLLLFMLVGCNNPNPLNSEEPSISESSEEPPSSLVSEEGGTKSFNFFALNDFHGGIQETEDDPGIFKISSYLKTKYAANNGGTAFFNSGDMWQGSADSNLNKGQLLTKMLNELDTEAMALGNHEFDWYDTAIEANKAIADFPFLGANIMNKTTGKLATNLVSYDDTFKASHMFTKKGVNFGVIGTIGSSLESSILGLSVANYSFEPVTNYIIEEATNLKALGADIIVLLTHDSVSSGGEYANVLQGKYVDMIFSGHAHSKTNTNINGIPVMQTNGYGRQLMEVNFSYNTATNKIVIDEQKLIEGSAIKAYPSDPEMLAVYAPYEEETELIKNEQIGVLVNSLNSTGLLNIANRTMYDYAASVLTDSSNDLVVTHNGGGVRFPSIAAGNVIYGDIFRVFPFDNEVMIIKDITGADLNSLIKGDYKGYHPGVNKPFDANGLYDLATIDFISFRQNAVTLKYAQTSTGVYVRDLIRSLFIDEGTINANDFNYY